MVIRRRMSPTIHFSGENLSPLQKYYDGKPFTVLQHVTSPTKEFPLEDLPIYIVLLRDREQTAIAFAWPEEVEDMYIRNHEATHEACLP